MMNTMFRRGLTLAPRAPVVRFMSASPDALTTLEDKQLKTSFGDEVTSHLTNTPMGSIAERHKYHWTIYKPSRCVMQHGQEKSVWKLKLHKKKVWQNPLMGWTATDTTADMVEPFLHFDTAEEAKRFCEREGLPYSVEKPNKRKKQIRAIADNWAYIPIEKE